MRTMKNNVLKFSLIALFFFAYTLPVMAQEDDSPGEPTAEDDPQMPIDNWTILLVMVALALGIYFMRKYRLAGKSN